MANSGKVKRIRNNVNLNITPCKLEGTPTGSWVPAIAQEVTGLEIAKKVNQQLEKKYGLMKKMLALQAKRQGRQDTILEIILVK